MICDVESGVIAAPNQGAVIVVNTVVNIGGEVIFYGDFTVIIEIIFNVKNQVISAGYF